MVIQSFETSFQKFVLRSMRFRKCWGFFSYNAYSSILFCPVGIQKNYGNKCFLPLLAAPYEIISLVYNIIVLVWWCSVCGYWEINVFSEFLDCSCRERCWFWLWVMVMDLCVSRGIPHHTARTFSLGWGVRLRVGGDNTDRVAGSRHFGSHSDVDRSGISVPCDVHTVLGALPPLARVFCPG